MRNLEQLKRNEIQESLLDEIIIGLKLEIDKIQNSKSTMIRDSQLLIASGEIKMANKLIEVLEAKKGVL